MKCPISPNCGEFENESHLALHLDLDHTSRELTLLIMNLLLKIDSMVKGTWKE